MQYDNHIPNLSVGETVNFAHTCQRGYREPEFSLSDELCRAKALSVVGAEGLQQQHSTDDLQPGCMGMSYSSNSKPRSSNRDAADYEQALVMDEIEHLIAQVWGTGAKTDVVMLLLGLGHCRDTLVGDGGLMLRGISGGERKRLTTAEMVVGPQRVLLMDEISTGLDSATLYSVITFFTSVSVAELCAGQQAVVA
eukprot:GHUV01053715.1.p1 GENE.GHUV01053715.1~~GHUV01053715.1.p1  ORF type:complete len:195 (+),score=54.18 GHUV01053715.1:492-1076(+)